VDRLQAYPIIIRIIVVLVPFGLDKKNSSLYHVRKLFNAYKTHKFSFYEFVT